MNPSSNRDGAYSSAQPVPVVQGGQPYPPPAVQPVVGQPGYTAAIVVNQGGGPGLALPANTSKSYATTCPG